MPIQILWLHPSTGENVSTRGERISEHLHDQGVNVDLVYASGLDSISAISRAVRGDYDLIVGNVRIGLYLGYILAIILRTPLISEVSDPIDQIDSLPKPLFRAFEMLEWWILERCEVSFYVESESYETAKQRDVTAVWAPNSVDYEEFAEPEEAVVEEARHILIQEGIDLERNLAVYAGSLTTDVHLAEVVEAVPMTDGWEIVLIGEDRGLSVESLTDDVDGVSFIGAVSHDVIPGIYAHAAAGIALVDAEQPLKLMEYGAASLPVLACPGKLTLRFTERQMVFVDPTSSNIARGLMQISQSPGDAAARAEGLQNYVKEYSWADVATKYLKAIRSQVTIR